MDLPSPKLNFSVPPPGFPPRSVQPYNTQPLPSPQGNEKDKYIPVKKELNSPQSGEPSSHSSSRYGYYQGSNIQPNYSRSSGQNMGMPYMHASSGLGMPPRHFNMPPPPPPPIALQNNFYSYAIPSTPSSSSSVIGAGQHATNKHGNYQHHHMQGDYSRGYDKRIGQYANANRKRSISREFQNDYDSPRKMPKKKKKPLSQNLPARKEWSTEEAQRALAVEREYNKLHKNPSLIIKFPDLELNRDIVSAFHPLIESVHFQQPSTPRFCFVTLSDSTRIDEVIESLNKTKFGLGYLSAEPKNTKDEESVKGPEDIDPLTLYVGNLAQEVTVDDVVKAYPKHKRIDIGFAKKMKYTRYAFVGFRTVDDAIEAFQSTHSTEMYSKSLIVRFRRLHGTVGLPGDAKTFQDKDRKQGKTPAEEQQIERDLSNTSDFYLVEKTYDQNGANGNSGSFHSKPATPVDNKTAIISIKSEFPTETEATRDHIPIIPLYSCPKIEPEDDLPETAFPQLAEIKQEVSDGGELELHYDFIKKITADDAEEM